MLLHAHIALPARFESAVWELSCQTPLAAWCVHPPWYPLFSHHKHAWRHKKFKQTLLFIFTPLINDGHAGPGVSGNPVIQGAPPRLACNLTPCALRLPPGQIDCNRATLFFFCTLTGRWAAGGVAGRAVQDGMPGEYDVHTEA